MTTLLAALAVAVALPPERPLSPTAAALSDFSGRLNASLQLREDLGRRLEPMAPTTSAGELGARRRALTAALRNARANARPGDLVPQPVQELIRQTVRADFARRNPVETRRVLDEVPGGPLPGINRHYPERAALPTIPPLLLAKLPRLPDNLQYRFFGRHVVILDGDTEMIIDYVRNALPR